MKVYVRWYKNVVEGELLDEEWQGMKQVRIPLDGCHPVALFAPEHVYQTEEEARAGEPHKKMEEENCGGPRKSTSIPEPHKPVAATIDDLNIVRFKEEHWDHERNHLRIDCLDEYYNLYRESIRMRCQTVSTDTIKMERPDSDKEASEVLSPKPAPVAKPQPKKPTKKQTQSSGEVQFNDSTQLALFN